MSKHKHVCNRVLILDKPFEDHDDDDHDHDHDHDGNEGDNDPNVRLSIVHWFYDKNTKKVTMDYIPRVSWAVTGINYGGKNNSNQYVRLKVSFVHDQPTQCTIDFDRRHIGGKPTKTVLKWIKEKFKLDRFGNNQDDHKT